MVTRLQCTWYDMIFAHGQLLEENLYGRLFCEWNAHDIDISLLELLYVPYAPCRRDLYIATFASLAGWYWNGLGP